MDLRRISSRLRGSTGTLNDPHDTGTIYAAIVYAASAIFAISKQAYGLMAVTVEMARTQAERDV
jgi:hypothetical protein